MAHGYQQESMARLAALDPEAAAAIAAEIDAAAGDDRTDRLGELCQPGRSRRPGQRADQQVRRGLSRSPLLWRL